MNDVLELGLVGATQVSSLMINGKGSRSFLSLLSQSSRCLVLNADCKFEMQIVEPLVISDCNFKMHLD